MESQKWSSLLTHISCKYESYLFKRKTDKVLPVCLCQWAKDVKLGMPCDLTRLMSSSLCFTHCKSSPVTDPKLSNQTTMALSWTCLFLGVLWAQWLVDLTMPKIKHNTFLRLPTSPHLSEFERKFCPWECKSAYFHPHRVPNHNQNEC